MLKPDKVFNQYAHHFDAANRTKARALFRRAVREYYTMQRRYVIDPKTGKQAQEYFYGEVIKQQKKQRRRLTLNFKGAKAVGRPPRFEIQTFMSRLFILWGRYANVPATLSWKSSSGKVTHFEHFLLDVLPRLGAPDVRRYVEAHWKARKY